MREKTGRYPKAPAPISDSVPSTKTASASEASSNVSSSNELFTPDMKAQLDAVFARMEQPLLLKLYLGNDTVSSELEDYMQTLASLTDKLSVEIADRQNKNGDAPCVRTCLSNGTETGLAFHGVPGGHEFTAFVLGLYNTAGPGQTLDSTLNKKISSISESIDIKILVSLSCTMCPETVTAAQKIAAMNPNIKAEVYDINHFAELKDHYHVMSVPCLIINDEKISFGKKNIGQILELL